VTTRHTVPERHPRQHRDGLGTTRPASGDDPLAVRVHVCLVGGKAGRALAAAQGRALADLLASLAEVEVGQGEEVSP
jgi:hypothetical protein